MKQTGRERNKGVIARQDKNKRSGKPKKNNKEEGRNSNPNHNTSHQTKVSVVDSPGNPSHWYPGNETQQSTMLHITPSKEEAEVVLYMEEKCLIHYESALGEHMNNKMC